MMNIYQSQVWKDIQHKIYCKPMIEVDLFGKTYFGSIKEKKIGPFHLKRYQIMGVEFPNNQTYIKEELDKLKKKFKGKGLFIQLGIINEIINFENKAKKYPAFDQDMYECRRTLQKILYKTYGLYPAFRENMPNASIVYDVTKSDEELLKDMSESCRKRIKKAIHIGLEYRILNDYEYEEFFVKRQDTATIKGFTTISKVQYERLIEYIQQGKGMLIGAYYEGKMIAGTICLFVDKVIYCPYGFFDRTYHTIGVQHFLKFKLFGRAREHGYTLVDTGGGAPTGFPKHKLANVSAFKESLGGIKTELFGSYDIVLNTILYQIMKLRYQIKG